MSSFPRADELIAVYSDDLEALDRLFRARRVVASDATSRFHGLSDAEIQGRLRVAREELARWALMMLVASFEAMIRADAVDRIQSKTKDDVRKPLRDLYQRSELRVRLDDILDIWEQRLVISATVKGNLRALLKHRHWLAHGRHWTNKHGVVPSPYDARAELDDYVQALAVSVPDFPRE